MPKRKLPPDEIIVNEYESGMSSGEIAERHNVAPITVISLLRRIGVPRRSIQEAVRIREEKGRGNRDPSVNVGRKQSPELIEKRISKIRGENHYLWGGGKSKRDYRKVVDKEQCETCGTTESLSIHHKDFDHYNNDPDNLQVLCVSCHMSLHKKAYWEAKRNGEPTPKSNGPVGWKR